MAELQPYDAPGLPADWLNAWLAAIGVTVLLPEVKLSWTDDVVPFARFWVQPEVDLPEAVADRLPSLDALRESAIARDHPRSAVAFPRNVTLDAYRSRARLERESHGYLLTATVSDLLDQLDEANLPHGAFDPTAPRGETLWSRAVKCREALESLDIGEVVAASLSGTAERVPANGLGFDCRRLVPGDQAGGVMVDPIIELLALAALRLFPFRGAPGELLQRGFTGRPSRRGSFRWSTWEERLDVWAIDALLDLPFERRGATGAWQLVPYTVPPPDNTRAYFSEPVVWSNR